MAAFQWTEEFVTGHPTVDAQHLRLVELVNGYAELLASHGADLSAVEVLLGELVDYTSASDRPLTCLMVDADGFKQINDSQGHDAGDLVLKRLARELVAAVRTDDIVCRLGGDEFLVICPNTGRAGGAVVGEALRATVAALHVAAGQGVWHGSVSVGVGARAPGMAEHEDLLKVADEGVYAAKRDGRNCVRTVQA
jgi:hemerythrin